MFRIQLEFTWHGISITNDGVIINNDDNPGALINNTEDSSNWVLFTRFYRAEQLSTSFLLSHYNTQGIYN